MRIIPLLIIITLSASSSFAYDITLTGQLNHNFWSLENIYTNGTCTVGTGSDVTLEANDGIVLGSGFHANSASGTKFTAIISTVLDNDSDNMPDSWELYFFEHLNWGADDDPDYDGFVNIDDYLNSTYPNDADTDDDGMYDGWEFLSGLNPLFDDALGDLDTDGYSNYVEYIGETDPTNDNDLPISGHYNKYDKLGRLKKTAILTGTQIEYEIEYDYDSVGNRTIKIVN